MKQKEIRKALELRLEQTLPSLIAITPPVYLNDPRWLDKTTVPWWRGNKAFDSNVPVYVRSAFSIEDKQFRELGRNARPDMAGTFLIQVFTPTDGGEDVPDNLAEAIEAAYPYANDLTFGQASVEISLTRPMQGAGTDGAHWLKPLMVYWKAWRV